MELSEREINLCEGYNWLMSLRKKDEVVGVDK